MAANGHSSRPTVPTWNPSALLQPNRRAAVARPPTNSQSSPDLQNLRSLPPSSIPRNNSTSSFNDPLSFQFTSPSGLNSTGPSSTASTPGSYDGSGGNGMGVGSWVDRVNHLQSRAIVPEPKRRKTEVADRSKDGANQQRRNGSGMLGAYVKDQRKAANQSPQPMAVDLTDGNDDDVIAIGDPKDEEVSYGMVKSSLNCTKVPSPKDGTKSLWGPAYHPGIKIVLKRLVGDQSLKIEAYDHTRETIGLVDAVGAAALTPLLDTNIQLRTDCRIPPGAKRTGEEPGQATSRSFVLDIVLYGPLKYARNVGTHLSRHNLRLIAPHMVQKGIRVQNPHVTEFRPPPPKAYPVDSNGSYVGGVNRTAEEVRSEVMGVFDSLTRSEDLPVMDPTERITTDLLHHQKQGLYFMVTREQPRELQAPEKSMVSFWQNKIGSNSQRLFSNVITGHTQKQPPPETRGGILADMMGLGKTLSILSLIDSTLEDGEDHSKRPPERPIMIESKPTRAEALPSATPALEMITPILNAKTTLLICPLSTITNWEEQIKQHIATDSMSCHIYHGASRIKDPIKLAQYDLVITTYGSVSNELASRRKGKEGQYPLEEIAWFRIVLDEAHMIREHSTLQFKAICRLQAQRRWAVTGTPVQNKLEDLGALLAFLRLYPFHDRSKFQRYIVEPFKVCDPEIVPKLRVLVDSVTLRRMKDKIDLPPRRDLVIKLEFSSEERRIYDMFAKNAQDRVKVLAGTDNNKTLGGNTYIHILKAILRLRLLCAHGKDLLKPDDLHSLQGMSKEMAIDLDDDDDTDKPTLSSQKAHEMFSLMQETNNDSCVECSKKLGANDGTSVEADIQDDVVGCMTSCFHVICRSCMEGYQQRARALLQPDSLMAICLSCQELVRLEFVELHRRDAEAEHSGPRVARLKETNGGKRNFDNYDGPHTKTQALLEDLLKSKAASEEQPNEPPFKSVVFSGWTTHLDLIEIALNRADITFVRLDGGMSRTARTVAMDRFREDDNVHVILVSIMAGGLGLNLTAGNSVYVMEPQYNPAAEAQAIDRVHRLGQTRPVRTVRYIMRDSFEEKMIELQEKKMKLASLSMDGHSKKLDKTEAARQKLMDLRSLFK